MQPNISTVRLTRDGIMRAFQLSADLVQSLEEAQIIRPDTDGMFDLAEVAAGLFNYGIQQGRDASLKLAEVGSALNDTLPALKRLATLPDNLKLEGEVRDKVTAELAVFFTAFSGLLTRATEALQADSTTH